MQIAEQHGFPIMELLEGPEPPRKFHKKLIREEVGEQSMKTLLDDEGRS
jgi:hypothetical protein